MNHVIKKIADGLLIVALILAIIQLLTDIELFHVMFLFLSGHILFHGAYEYEKRERKTYSVILFVIGGLMLFYTLVDVLWNQG
ncbi:hypothetical protein EQV77_02540 [Halobacillus fulvus]|nr:hypothetical protein EQV77_02540 [Halobacillus fulvus]